MADGKNSKTIFLVRHAQSEQNIATARLESGEVGALGDIIRLGHDAPVSSTGRDQLNEASRALAGFSAEHAVELVVHSPYQRAAETAKAIFAAHPKPMIVLPALHERTVTEYLFPWMLDARIAQVRAWIDAREEQCIALVGHGQWFKRCCGAPAVQPNVSIIRSIYTSAAGFVASGVA